MSPVALLALCLYRQAWPPVPLDGLAVSTDFLQYDSQWGQGVQKVWGRPHAETYVSGEGLVLNTCRSANV